MMIKDILKKIVPNPVFLFYHWTLARLAAFFYGFPSNKMIVIGVTGTAAKSTVVNLISQILEQAGFKVGLSTTFNFKIGQTEKINKHKMTMLGRFDLQKLLRKMSQNGCQYAIIETTSQGIKQYRHLGINYDVGIFTNLAKEHIESHGSFKKYRAAKQKFFKHLSKSKKKKINNKVIDKISVVNLDDPNKEYFLKYKVDKKYGYTIENNKLKDVKVVKGENIRIKPYGSEFLINNTKFKINLLGRFNVINALSAVCVSLSQNIDLSICQKALAKVEQIPGRMEVVHKQPFTIIIDYAHTPSSLEKVYQTLKPLAQGKMICVLGSAGGGRDKWKRPVMGEIAEKYGDEIIITNEDPYDEDPKEIINQVSSGIKKKTALKILNRKEAIKKAINIAREGDIVIITGKGCEPWIMGPNNQKIKWDDREVVKELLKNK